jgi:hypothetical protein
MKPVTLTAEFEAVKPDCVITDYEGKTVLVDGWLATVYRMCLFVDGEDEGKRTFFEAFGK